MTSTYLTRTQTAGNRRKGTFSAWFKKVNLTYQYLMSWNSTTSGTSYGDWIRFNGEQLDILKYTGAVVYRVQTNRLFKDTNAWYHLVVAYDSEQATASNRIKIYVNGVQETSLNETTYPSQNFDFQFNNNNIVACVGKNYNTEANFDGSMSHVHFIDGTAYDASAFGETDATTGEWKIKTSVNVNYGTNGFWILKDGNSVTDQSGNSNNFTVGGGTLTKTEDSPSNVFATFNPLLVPTNGTVLFTNGNNSIRTSNSQQQGACSTLGASSGKFYWECKQTANSAGTNGNILIAPYFPFEIATRSAYSASGFKGAISYGSHGGVYIGDAEWNTTTGSNSNASGSWSTYTVGDIVSVALDLDNNYVYFGKNGAWQNSGNPESGSNGTGGISLNVSSSYTKADGEFYFFGTADQGSSSYANYDANFGNGYFGTTAVASAGTNASGNGIFEFDCPVGYTALSTKGLNL